MDFAEFERRNGNSAKQTSWPTGRSVEVVPSSSQKVRNERNCSCKSGTCHDCIKAAYMDFYDIYTGE
jgi:hypothetical protein